MDPSSSYNGTTTTSRPSHTSSTSTDEQLREKQDQLSLSHPNATAQPNIPSLGGIQQTANMPPERPYSARASDRRLYEPEKSSLPASKNYSVDDVNRIPRHKEEAMKGLKKDLGALVNFMTCMPFVGLGVALYTFLALLATAVFAPLNMCLSNRASLRTQLRIFLLPATNFHYRCAWSDSRATRDNIRRSWPGSPAASISRFSDTEMQHTTQSMDPPSNITLVAVHLLSPLLSIPVFFAAIVVALWWIMSAITADDTADGFSSERPRREGQGGFDEGQKLARGLRLWWVGWLSGRAFG